MIDIFKSFDKILEKKVDFLLIILGNIIFDKTF